MKWILLSCCNKKSSPLVFLKTVKYFIPILVGFTITLTGGVLLASAQGYDPLVALPGVTEVGKKVEIGAYLADMMKFIVALAGVFAIIVAIIGGTQYVAAGISPNAKNDAKERMINAFIGLTLVLVSWLILNSINPKLVILNFKLPPVTGTAVTTSGPGALGIMGDTCGVDPDTEKARMKAGESICVGATRQQLCDTSKWTAAINAAASKYGVPVKMIQAIITIESSCRENPGSIDGKSCGLMQVVGGCSLDPAANIDQGTKILKGSIVSAKAIQTRYGNLVTYEQLVYNAYNGGGKDNTPSVSCATSSGWPIIPKWACPIDPGTTQYNACFEKKVACKFGGFF